eukprot:TRINITY_DN1113_c0_g2_i1.p2 TRINITY_DN1113_c0_g2~~TRINITY_DN1113_c0_g2_i1.p2  ORF type:complete len:116 (-),score=13.44 TRINITY_DN1113_c0_g2_i1:167-514(-)
MALVDDITQQLPREGSAVHVLAPVGLEGVMGLAQVVRGDLGGNVVGHVNIDVVSQILNPPGVLTVHSVAKTGLGVIPLVLGHKGNVRQSVMDHGEGGHPEVVAQPRLASGKNGYK